MRAWVSRFSCGGGECEGGGRTPYMKAVQRLINAKPKPAGSPAGEGVVREGEVQGSVCWVGQHLVNACALSGSADSRAGGEGCEGGGTVCDAMRWLDQGKMGLCWSHGASSTHAWNRWGEGCLLPRRGCLQAAWQHGWHATEAWSQRHTLDLAPRSVKNESNRPHLGGQVLSVQVEGN